MSVLKKDQLERLEKAIEKQKQEEKDYYVGRIRKKVERYIEDLEDLSLAQERLADIHSGKTKTIPHEEVMRENGLL